MVVPRCNEAPNIDALCARVTATTRSQGYTSRLVLVDEGSRDATRAYISALAAHDATVLAVKLLRNHRHQLELTAGRSVSTGERVLILDADLQDSPEVLPQMMALMDERFDFDVTSYRDEKLPGEARWIARLWHEVLGGQSPATNFPSNRRRAPAQIR